MTNNWKSTLIDVLSVLACLVLVALVLCWGKCSVPNTMPDKHEGFTNGQDDFFGNLLAYKSAESGIPSNTIIPLPGNVRLTGFNTTTFNSDEPVNIRLYIADNVSDARSADTRTEIVDPRKKNNTTTLKSDVPYNDYLNMFHTNSGYYTGSVILVEIVSSATNTDDNNNNETLSNNLVLESVAIYGMPVNALDKSDYDKMPLVTAVNTRKTSDTYRITLTAGDFKVGYLHIPGLRVHTAFNIQIQYSNSLDGNNTKYNIEGPNRLHWSDGQSFIYLAEPVIAQNIYISVPNVDMRASTMSLLDEGVHIYAFPTSKRDIINFKLRGGSGLSGGMGSARDHVGIVIAGRKCPNVRDMMHKQLQAQQICEALEYKDKAKNNKIAYEKEKTFLAKLQQQDSEIQDLESIIDRLMARKQGRLEAAEGHNMEEVDKEFQELSKLKADVEQHLAASKAPTSGVNLDVKLQPK